MNRPLGETGHRTFLDETTGNGLFEVLGGSTTQLRSAQLAVFGDVDNDFRGACESGIPDGLRADSKLPARLINHYSRNNRCVVRREWGRQAR